MPAYDGAAASAAQEATDKAEGEPAAVSADRAALVGEQLVLIVKDAFKSAKAQVAQPRAAPPQQLLFRRQRHRQPAAVKCPALAVTKTSDLAAPVMSAAGAAS